ncbi:hypothetical protein INT43_004936 [Umbelopsis isabellina]|uniref:Aquaporin n=1 Tax=Mortierella isabellina TaxID=91625 RepID=A0A8H7PEE0_MORIS|nr:hypothetical protein INT43_004936 [Umbelopsis isabellina]
MDSEEERGQESETETVIDLSLGSTHEGYKSHSSGLPSRWNMWRLKRVGFKTELVIILGSAVTLSIYITGDISGAHLNPVVTVVLAVFRKFPPKKIVTYAIAQFVGAFTAAAILYLNVAADLDLIDGGHRVVTGQNATLKIFTTIPLPAVDTFAAISSEIVCSAVLLFVTFGLMHQSDPGHRTIQPILVGMLVALISLGMGVNTGPSMNPARDLGPRTFTALAGWGTGVFTVNHYYFWIPNIIPFIGGAIGACLYDIFLSI